MNHQPKFEDSSYKPPGLPEDFARPGRRSGSVAILATVAIGMGLGAGASEVIAAPVKPETTPTRVNIDNPADIGNLEPVRLHRTHRPKSDKKKIKYGPTETLPLMGEQDVTAITEVLTRKENDPGLESLFFQQQELFYSIYQESGGYINQSAVSRYGAYLEDQTAPEIKTLLQQSFDQEETYWNRQNELSRTNGYNYINPAQTINQILSSKSVEEAIAVLDETMRSSFGFNVQISDDISADFMNAKAGGVKSSHIDKSQEGLRRLQVGLAVVARSMGKIPTQLRADVKTMYITNDLSLDSSKSGGVVRGDDGTLWESRKYGGLMYPLDRDLKTNISANVLLIDINEFANLGFTAEDLVVHEYSHAIDKSYFDLTEQYKKDKYTNVVFPSIRIIDPPSAGTTKPKIIHRDWLSESIAWTRHSSPDGVFNTDGTPGINFGKNFIKPYGSTNSREDFATSISDLLTHPESFVGELNYQISEKGAVSLQPKDLKRMSFMFSTAARAHRKTTSFAKDLRDRSIVFAGKGGSK